MTPELAVVPEVQEEAVAPRVQALEPRELPARGAKVRQQALVEPVRPHAVEEKADDDAAPRGVGQEPKEARARLVRVPDVELQVDVVARPGDPRLER